MLFVPVVEQHRQPPDALPLRPGQGSWIRKERRSDSSGSRHFLHPAYRRSDGVTQDVVVGIDPGSKKEGLTVKSASHTYLNIQADAVTHVKEAKADQRYPGGRDDTDNAVSATATNRARGGLPPSTKARWQWKLRLPNWLRRLFPITQVVVEDIKAQTQGKPRWDTAFSPLEVGKQWFYDEVRKLVPLDTFEGSETKQMHDALGLKKTKTKMADLFEAHCVDSWVLRMRSLAVTINPTDPAPLRVAAEVHRREPHRRQPGIEGCDHPTEEPAVWDSSAVRPFVIPSMASPTSAVLRKDESVSITMVDGKRLCQNAKPSDVQFLAYSTWRMRSFSDLPEGAGFRR